LEPGKGRFSNLKGLDDLNNCEIGPANLAILAKLKTPNARIGDFSLPTL
jgi:hypothetical protein